MDNTTSILQKAELTSLTNDIHFHKELMNNASLKKQIYFDTSGVIDMLLGMDRIFSGDRIKWGNYNKSATLVYALAFNNWLGPIHTLPPHTEELIDKIQHDKSLFKEKFTIESERLQERFWYNKKLKIQDIKNDILDKKNIAKWVVNLKEESLELFKGIYLGDHKNFWKYRYKYLVKEKNILQFSSEQDYQFGNISNTPFFKKLYHYLMGQREKSSNNYIDAIALCLLNKKLKSQILNNPTGQIILPIFFSDQDHILKAVEEFSKTPDEDGFYPFTYICRHDRFLIVRNANFFVINGIFNALQNEEKEQELAQFSNMLDNIDSMDNYITSDPNSGTRHQLHGPNISDQLVERVIGDSEEKVFLDFFNKWWAKNGFDKLTGIINENFIKTNRTQIENSVEAYINKERVKLNKILSYHQGRIRIIKKTHKELGNLKFFIKNQFKLTEERLNIYKEFSPRFSFTEQICSSVQDLTDRIFNAVRAGNKQELDICKEEIVTDLIYGLYEQANNPEEEENKLGRLAKSIAVLWTYQKYDLIEEICSISRRIYETLNKSDDKYPSASIALMHAASIFLGRKNDINEALLIIKCVESKFGKNNYKVWISLSYLYFLIWNVTVDEIDFQELRPNTDKGSFNKKANDAYLSKAIKYAKKAHTYLDKIRNNLKEIDKQKYRQRKYYYALNNYIFFMTISAEKTAFLALEPLVKKLENIKRNEDIWQAGRFSDTIARFYLRFAILAASKKEFDYYIKWAKGYNSDSIKQTTFTNPLYQGLERQLEEIDIKGYANVNVNARQQAL